MWNSDLGELNPVLIVRFREEKTLRLLWPSHSPKNSREAAGFVKMSSITVPCSVHAGQMRALSIATSQHAWGTVTFPPALVLALHHSCVPFTYC